MRFINFKIFIMKISPEKDVILSGLAIFSMFFGAGNFILPMIISKSTNYNFMFSSFGFFFTSTIFPALALILMLNLNGNYKYFLSYIGRWPAFIFTILMMSCTGSFGSLPRCISLSYAASNLYLPGLTNSTFSAISCIVIFFLSIRRKLIVSILGKFLTPILIIGLFLIIIIGLNAPPIGNVVVNKNINYVDSFYYGLKMGSLTMDLFSSFFFAGIIIPSFNSILRKKIKNKKKDFFLLTFKSCCIGIGLLAVVYEGLFLLSKKHIYVIQSVLTGEEFTVIAKSVLGSYGAFLASLSISLACLTTAIALAVIFSEFIECNILHNKIPYPLILFTTMSISFIVAKLEFSSILILITPWLEIIYPAMIILVLCHLIKIIVGIEFIKIPFYGALIVAMVYSDYFQIIISKFF